jgi:sugar fermentation stimulation protein A
VTKAAGVAASARRAIVAVPLPGPLRRAVFVRRVNRFVARLRLEDSRALIYAHLPNSGRMTELLVPGAVVLVHPATGAGRRTRGTALLVRHRGQWVGLDATLPNRLLAAALRRGALPPLPRPTAWRQEVRLRGERIDFVLQAGASTWLLETKSCNRVEAEEARFPDAPTARGVRHLQALARAARKGARAAVVWFVQRPDARVLRVDAAADAALARAAAHAARAGVLLVAYTCRVDPTAVSVWRRIPVIVGAAGGPGR